MARKNLQTPDGKHIQFGEVDTTKMPESWFNPGGDAATCSQWMGGENENPNNAGFGSAYREREDYPDTDD